MVENYNAQNEIEKGKPSQEIDKKLASKIIFNSTFKAINEEFKNLGSKGTEIIFNKIASGNFDIDNQKKVKKQKS